MLVIHQIKSVVGWTFKNVKCVFGYIYIYIYLYHDNSFNFTCLYPVHTSSRCVRSRFCSKFTFIVQHVIIMLHCCTTVAYYTHMNSPTIMHGMERASVRMSERASEWVCVFMENKIYQHHRVYVIHTFVTNSFHNGRLRFTFQPKLILIEFN